MKPQLRKKKYFMQIFFLGNRDKMPTPISRKMKNKNFEGWAQDYSNSDIFLKPLFRGNLDPFVNNANFHCLQKEML